MTAVYIILGILLFFFLLSLLRIGVRVEPMAFLVVKGGVTRMLPVGAPAITTVDRVIEMVPELLDRVEGFVDKKRNKDF